MSYTATQAQAVLIFDGKELAREMLFSEFEAVLDGFVPLAEQAGQTVTAVYVCIESQLQVSAAVFFLIDFDKAGFADKRWNVPIEQLAQTSADGPDMGVGPIRLACRSQCAIAWHQQQLWDPQMTPQCNHFAVIKRAVKRNGLRLEVSKPVPTLEPSQAAITHQKLTSDNDGVWRKKIAQAIKEHRLRATTIERKGRQALDDQADQHRQAVAALESELASLKRKLSDAQASEVTLEEQSQGLQQKIQGLREYFEHKLNSLKSMDSSALATLKDHLEAEKHAEIEALRAEFAEKVQMRDIELMYRETQVTGLKEEVQKLQTEKHELLGASGNNLLEQLHTKGISFVTFQPGAGHMTIPIDDISTFIDDPDAYTADKCRVDKGLFGLWRKHYQQPSCTADSPSGERCGQPLARVDRPSEFTVGSSDRCPEHQHDQLHRMTVVSS